MEIELDKKSPKHLATSPLIQQTGFWAQVKENHGLHTMAFDTSTRLTGTDAYIHHSGKQNGEKIIHRDLLILLQPIGDGAHMAYAPYGPKYQPHEEWRGKYLEELSESLKPYLPESCLFIRYDLPWRSPWINDENRFNDRGNWMGTPEPRVRELRMNIDTNHWQLRTSPTNVLPSNTVFIDLSRTHEQLLADMKPKTRYNIRLAGRKGVCVYEAGLDELPVWYDLYKETTQRNGITRDHISYFRSVFQSQHEHMNTSAKVYLLMAKVGSTPLAGLFLSISGGRATYLYGASSTQNRQYMATYALQWEAMQLAKREGCTEYDMFGIAEIPSPGHPMYGLYRFKTGFGGSIYRRQGCWDYPLQEKTYEQFRSVELNAEGYHMRVPKKSKN